MMSLCYLNAKMDARRKGMGDIPVPVIASCRYWPCGRPCQELRSTVQCSSDLPQPGP